MIQIFNQDCREQLEILQKMENIIIVTDPPFNIGYHYNSYKDSMSENEYYKMLTSVLKGKKAVVIHYPEALHRLSMELEYAPTRVVSWCYNSNTAKQHRDVAFYNVSPDFNKVRQPYKNPKDKRIKERIERGCTGGRLYDWWNVNQVKNTSKEKTKHPCQMPLEVMKNIIGILPEEFIIVDPFMGSGTTGVACQALARDFIGFELDSQYFNLSKERLAM